MVFETLIWREIQGVIVILAGILRSLPMAKTVSVTEVLDHYLNYTLTVEKRAVRTYNNRKDVLKPFFRRLEIEDLKQITLQDIDSAFAVRGLHIKKTTYSQERQIVRSFFQFCAEYRKLKLSFNYLDIKRVKAKAERRRIPSDEEVAMALKACKERQDALIIRTIIKTGMRIGEIATFEVRDIKGNTVSIRGKGEKDRLTYLTDALLFDIQKHNVGKKPHERVFQPLQKHFNHNNTHYTTSRLRERIQAIFASVGVTMTPHDLRHYFAIKWLLDGGDIRSLQIVLGHESIETTQIYLQLADKQVQGIHKKIVSND